MPYEEIGDPDDAEGIEHSGTDGSEDEPEVPRPVAKINAKTKRLEDYAVSELLSALGQAIKKQDKFEVLRVVINGVPFRLPVAFICEAESCVSIFVLKDSYEPFEESEKEIEVTFRDRKLKVLYAGGLTRLPGFCYDIVSFVIVSGATVD